MTGTGTIYLIRAGSTNLYKIGFTTKTPEKRMASLQTGNPYPLEVVSSWIGTVHDERRIHGVLAPFRKEGEWFELSIEGLISHICQQHDAVPEVAVQPRIRTDNDVVTQVLQDINANYLDHGPKDDGGRVEVSPYYQQLLVLGILDCNLWCWYDADEIYKCCPFEKGERVGRIPCLDYCVEEGYIQVQDSMYRVDPCLSESGYDFFMDMAEPFPA